MLQKLCRFLTESVLMKNFYAISVTSSPLELSKAYKLLALFYNRMSWETIDCDIYAIENEIIELLDGESEGVFLPFDGKVYFVYVGLDENDNEALFWYNPCDHNIPQPENWEGWAELETRYQNFYENNGQI